MKTVSENPPKRGRPKSFACEYAESLERSGLGPQTAHSKRAKIDYAHRLAFIGAYHKADPETQARIMGCTFQEIRSGTCHFPPGFDTAATEIGRWLALYEESDDAKEQALKLTADARTRGIGWREIKNHFRMLRLGERQGNAISLFIHLARAFDDYCRKFPATTQAAKVGGVRNLLDAIQLPEE